MPISWIEDIMFIWSAHYLLSSPPTPPEPPLSNQSPPVVVDKVFFSFPVITFSCILGGLFLGCGYCTWVTGTDLWLNPFITNEALTFPSLLSLVGNLLELLGFAALLSLPS